MATLSAALAPHVVPLCFVYDGGAFYTHLKNGQDYKRMRNVAQTRRVAILVDWYNPAWRLGQKRGGNIGVLVEGRPRVISRGRENSRSRSLLTKKYPQYRGSEVESGCPMLKVSVQAVTSWGFG